MKRARKPGWVWGCHRRKSTCRKYLGVDSPGRVDELQPALRPEKRWGD